MTKHQKFYNEHLMNQEQSVNYHSSLEWLKFFAALMITNSHFGELYGKYSIFATGGAIGDALFFFCSGIALSLARFDRFDNWYKRRFFRVYPSVIATNLLAIIVGLVISYDSALRPFVGGGWFFKAILLFYLIIYLLRTVLGSYLKYLLPAILVSIFILSWFYVNHAGDVYSSGSYFAWYVYFSVFLFGFVFSHFNDVCSKHVNLSLAHYIIGLLLSFILYYGFLAICNRFNGYEWIRVFSVFPLFSLLICFYKVCDSNFVLKLSQSKLYSPIQFVSSLCWEIYLAQLFIVLPYPGLFTKTFPLPFNLICTLLLIVITAYVIKVLSRFIIQLFSRDAFDWPYMLKTWIK